MLIRRFTDMQTNRHYQYVRNRQGSVTAVVDDAGNTVQRTGYYPSGTPYILPCDYSASSVNSLTPATDRLHIGNIWIGSGGLNLYDNTARLHDPILCSFTTPDPQAFKYPGVNPYTHCAGNFTNIIDPTGEDTYIMDVCGYIINVTEDSNKIQFEIVDGEGKEVGTIELDSKTDITIASFFAGDTRCDIIQLHNDDEGLKLFQDLARYTTVEWGHFKTGIKGEKGLNFISTSHEESQDLAGTALFDRQLQYGYTIRMHNHNHRYNSFPSGLVGKAGDIQFAEKVTRITNQNVFFGILFDGKYIYYNKDSKLEDFGLSIKKTTP